MLWILYYIGYNFHSHHFSINSSAGVFGSECALKCLVSVECDLTTVIPGALLKHHHYLIMYLKLTNWCSTTPSTKFYVGSVTLVSVTVQENS